MTTPAMAKSKEKHKKGNNVVSHTATMKVSSNKKKSSSSTKIASAGKFNVLYKGQKLPATSSNCLASTIYAESRGEPERGQLAVGSVMMNLSNIYGKDICDVLLGFKHNGSLVKPFVWFRGYYNIVDAESWSEAKSIADKILAKGIDRKYSNYLAFNTVGYGSKSRKYTIEKIGSHIFYNKQI